MGDSRSTYGLVVAAFGAALLGVAVFLPWYGVSFTADGVAFIGQVGDQASAQYGNAALQAYVGTVHASLGGFAGHEFIALSAHQALKQINILLLILAGLGGAIALFGLACSASSADGNRGTLVVLGAVATVCLLFRIVDPPTAANDLLALSLREGAWLALVGAAAMTGGALWPHRRTREPAHADIDGVWSGMSGWTPEP